VRAEADAADLLALRVSHSSPQMVVDIASRLAGCLVGAYVVDLDGSCAIRLAGDEEQFPPRINAPLGIGPELPIESLSGLRRFVSDLLGDCVVVPMVVRDRIMGFLVARGRPVQDLAPFAEQAGLALELASAYTDTIHAVRRRKQIQPAAEIQQNLLPPRLAQVEGARLAGGVLPGYDVGGDFFDYACNVEGLWLVVADVAGKGNAAAALASLALGALRAGRRSYAGLQKTAQIVHEAIRDADDVGRFMTAVIALWEPARQQLRWLNCGHPSPLLLHADGRIDELDGGRTYPLGLFDEQRDFPLATATVAAGDRLILYSDGISERRCDDGSLFGVEGLDRVLSENADASAAAIARALQDALIGAASVPLRDDATLLVMTADA
jgi:serine phosphatase RsbU (regulator of sigma subunit)